jgi:hypothetical protein
MDTGVIDILRRNAAKKKADEIATNCKKYEEDRKYTEAVRTVIAPGKTPYQWNCNELKLMVRLYKKDSDEKLSSQRNAELLIRYNETSTRAPCINTVLIVPVATTHEDSNSKIVSETNNINGKIRSNALTRHSTHRDKEKASEDEASVVDESDDDDAAAHNMGAMAFNDLENSDDGSKSDDSVFDIAWNYNIECIMTLNLNNEYIMRSDLI